MVRTTWHGLAGAGVGRTTFWLTVVGGLLAGVILTGCGAAPLPPRAAASALPAAAPADAAGAMVPGGGSGAPATTATPAVAPAAPCAGVTPIAGDSAEGQAIGKAILDAVPANQPPDLQQLAPFAFAAVPSMEQVGDRVVVQASFTRGLEPAIFVLHETADGYQYDGVAWAGQAANIGEIRAALRHGLPEIGAALIDCLQVDRGWVRR